MQLVGNDIVDLQSDGIRGRSSDDRFLSRVFSLGEQSEILAFSHPDILVWAFWAAKETAYKIFSKIQFPAVFSPRRYQVRLLRKSFDLGDFSYRLNLRVVHQNYVFSVNVLGGTQMVHAVGRMGEAFSGEKIFFNAFQWDELPSSGDDLIEPFFRSSLHESERTRWGVDGAIVRYHCRWEIAGRLGLSMERVTILRPTVDLRKCPPVLRVDGRDIQIDVSLSHHGRWVGWAYFIPEAVMEDPEFALMLSDEGGVSEKEKLRALL